MMNAMVLSSSISQAIIHCFDDIIKIGGVINSKTGIICIDLKNIKKISLSMNYEPISFFSLSYYRMIKIVNFWLVL